MDKSQLELAKELEKEIIFYEKLLKEFKTFKRQLCSLDKIYIQEWNHQTSSNAVTIKLSEVSKEINIKENLKIYYILQIESIEIYLSDLHERFENI